MDAATQVDTARRRCKVVIAARTLYPDSAALAAGAKVAIRQELGDKPPPPSVVQELAKKVGRFPRISAPFYNAPTTVRAFSLPWCTLVTSADVTCALCLWLSV